MRFPHHVRMCITRRGEKELRLAAFIARGVQGMASQMPGVAAGQPEQGELLAIARSVQSPLVKAIATRASEIAAAGGTMRLILAKPDGLALSDALAAMRAAFPACEVRLARNPRLIEAHEQLTIGARIAWTGDSMRRDPATCDAYESFVEDCPQIAAAAAATFERLWRDCAPLAADAMPAAGAMETQRAALPIAGPARRA
jgi:hypothetical protein